MKKDEHKAYKFAKSVQDMLKEKGFTKEQVNIILAQLLGYNGYEGMADIITSQECDIRENDCFFLNGRYVDNKEFGIITFEQLSLALTFYTGRFWLTGLAKKNRDKSFRCDNEAAKKLTFVWRDNHTKVDLEKEIGAATGKENA